MKLLKAHRRTLGDGKPMAKEELIPELKFHKHKFNNRPKPDDKRKILFIICFSEFGCESLSLMYCIPKILQENPSMYVICVGWYGREYLYRHLVDEYWELHEEFQWLREYVSAFIHTSKNIAKLEASLQEMGSVFVGANMGRFCLGNSCLECKNFWGSDEDVACPKCKSTFISKSLLSDIPHHKKFCIRIPKPTTKTQNRAQNYLKPNAVGIFARGRAMYGRNLPPEFYVNLINLLESKGYNPIWLGEKQSVIPCPVDHILDFSRLEECRDLELTLAIIGQLKFTIQFWTASTRLASMMDVPWILFESPDQIVGAGQEGKRIALTTDFNKKKIILSQYVSALENQDKALNLVDQAIEEINAENWNDIIGLVDQPEIIKAMLAKQQIWGI